MRHSKEVTHMRRRGKPPAPMEARKPTAGILGVALPPIAAYKYEKNKGNTMQVSNNGKMRVAVRDLWEARWREGDGTGPVSSYAGAMLRGEESRGKDVLEIGCGNMSFSKALTAYARSYVGIDIAKTPLASAAHIMGNARFSLVCSDALSLPFGGESFDSVIAVQTLTIFGRDLAKALAEACRVLRAGGAMSFDIMHSDWLEANRLPAMQLPGGGFIAANSRSDMEVIAYDERSISAELRRHGLHAKVVETMTSYEFDTLGMGFCQRFRRGREQFDGVNLSMLIRAVKV